MTEGGGPPFLDGLDALSLANAEAGLCLHLLAERLPVALRTALSSPAELRGWSTSSERHPNGFTKFRLREWPDGSQLRLHVWERRTAVPDVHNHRWSFLSLPLVGNFVEVTYDLAEGNGTVLECDSRDRDGYVDVRAVACTGVQRVAAYRRRAGELYGGVAGDFHTLVPSSGGVSGTLVYHAAPQQSVALVWRDDDSRARSIPSTASPVATPHLEPGGVKRLFRSLLVAR